VEAHFLFGGSSWAAGVAHKVFIGNPRDVRSDVQTGPTGRPRSLTLNRLIRHWFDIPPHKYVKGSLLRCNMKRSSQRAKISLANFSFCITLSHEGGNSPFFEKESQMAWKTPKIVEVPVGMEINMYACAARK
jgi:coenzyme PQQ precursor peptide PqqA